MNKSRMMLAIVCATTMAIGVQAQCCKSSEGDQKAADLKPQATCPVMGGAINKQFYADVGCCRIYVCCKDCIEKVKADPQQYLKKIRENGERPECRCAVCSKCGEIKGTTKCCAKDAVKCDKCGLNKGSVGCCKNLKPASGQDEVVLCPKCGEIQGTPACCKADAPRCEKCKLIKDSPGCCKLNQVCPKSCSAQAPCQVQGTPAPAAETK